MARAQIVRSPSTGMTRRTFVAKEWGVIAEWRRQRAASIGAAKS